MEKSFCDGIIVSQHNRYKCFRCRRKIGIGLPVLRKGENTHSYGFQTHSICHHCAEAMLKYEEDDVKMITENHNKIVSEFEKIKEECSKALILDKIMKGQEEEEARRKREAEDAEWKKQHEEWQKRNEAAQKAEEEKFKQEIIAEYEKSKRNKGNVPLSQAEEPEDAEDL